MNVDVKQLACVIVGQIAPVNVGAKPGPVSVTSNMRKKNFELCFEREDEWYALRRARRYHCLSSLSGLSGLSGLVGGAAPKTLLDGLISYWKMDESSGQRMDSHGSNHLQDLTSVGSVVGKIGDAASFDYSLSQYLITENNDQLLVDGFQAWTLAYWVNLQAITGGATVHQLVGKASTGGTDWNSVFIRQSQMFAMASGNTSLSASSFGTTSANTWYFLVCGRSVVNGHLHISINNGTKDTAPFSSSVTPTSSPVSVGGETSFGRYSKSYIDEIGFWKRELTDNEISYLYNSGNGRTYEELNVVA